MNQITTLICVSAQCHLKYCICSVIAEYLGIDISPQGCGGAHRGLLYGHIPSLTRSEIIDSEYFPVRFHSQNFSPLHCIKRGNFLHPPMICKPRFMPFLNTSL